LLAGILFSSVAESLLSPRFSIAWEFSDVFQPLLSLAGVHLIASHETAILRDRISTVTEPAVGVGTTFTLWLPATAPLREDARANSTDELAASRRA
jgi:hypothetical protein